MKLSTTDSLAIRSEIQMATYDKKYLKQAKIVFFVALSTVVFGNIFVF